MKYNIRWVILSLIIVASFVAYVLRTNMSIVAATMAEDLQLTETHLGWIAAAFAFGYALFQFPGGLLGSKYGPRLVIAIMALIWGVLTVATALVPDTDTLSIGWTIGSLLVVRFLVGMTHAPFFPCVSGAAIANWFPQGGWGVPNGLSSTGLTLGAAATAPIIVLLMESFGWRGAILATAPTAFVVAVVWWWYMRDHPREHKSITEKELAIINRNRSTGNAQDGEEKGAALLVVRNKNILLLMISYFCMNYIFYLFFSWFFYYLTEIKGIGATEASFLNAALWVLGAVGATVGGIACDQAIKRFGFRRGPAAICVTGLALCGVCLFAGAMATDAYVAVALFCLSFAATQITEASFWSTSISVAGKHAAAAGGVMNTGGNVAGIVGGFLVPLASHHFGWTAAIASGALFAIVGAILWLFIRGDEPMSGLADAIG